MHMLGGGRLWGEVVGGLQCNLCNLPGSCMAGLDTHTHKWVEKG